MPWRPQPPHITCLTLDVPHTYHKVDLYIDTPVQRNKYLYLPNGLWDVEPLLRTIHTLSIMI